MLVRGGLSREVERKEASISIWEGGVAHSQLETLPKGTQRALPNSPVAVSSGWVQVFWTRCFHLTLTESMQMRKSCEAVMPPKVLSSALVVLMVSAQRDIGIDPAQSIGTTFKWGNILGDTAAVFRFYRYFLIQLRRWRPFSPCWSETLNACEKLLPK